MFDKLFIFEVANNHCGSFIHALHIISSYASIASKFPFTFAFKFQYRDINTFIHPQWKENSKHKYVTRFQKSQLEDTLFKTLVDKIKQIGFLTICTPFDEPSVQKVVDHGYDIIKIASCSATDWPLLEAIAQTNKPLILSTAGISLEDLDKVVTFLENRNKEFCIMHCVGEYPTTPENLQLNQIRLLKERYKNHAIGYSTHEEPNNIDAIKIAIGQGATVFEKHVDVPIEDHERNAYSVYPDEAEKWLKSAQEAFTMCGVSGNRHVFSQKELSDLRQFQRGIFAAKDLVPGQIITRDDIYFAFPNQDLQFVANDFSKYNAFTALQSITKDSPLLTTNTSCVSSRGVVLKIIKEVGKLLKTSHIALPSVIDLQLSHHYGIENFFQTGAVIINCVNREYCKKLLIMLSNQTHPQHYHKKKEETFYILYGELDVYLPDKTLHLSPGDYTTILRDTPHSFSTTTGCIFEEISTTHFIDDSFYQDTSIQANPNRKTDIRAHSNWLLE